MMGEQDGVDARLERIREEQLVGKAEADGKTFARSVTRAVTLGALKTAQCVDGVYAWKECTLQQAWYATQLLQELRSSRVPGFPQPPGELQAMLAAFVYHLQVRNASETHHDGGFQSFSEELERYQRYEDAFVTSVSTSHMAAQVIHTAVCKMGVEWAPEMQGMVEAARAFVARAVDGQSRRPTFYAGAQHLSHEQLSHRVATGYHWDKAWQLWHAIPLEGGDCTVGEAADPAVVAHLIQDSKAVLESVSSDAKVSVRTLWSALQILEQHGVLESWSGSSTNKGILARVQTQAQATASHTNGPLSDVWHAVKVLHMLNATLPVSKNRLDARLRTTIVEQPQTSLDALLYAVLLWKEVDTVRGSLDRVYRAPVDARRPLQPWITTQQIHQWAPWGCALLALLWLMLVDGRTAKPSSESGAGRAESEPVARPVRLFRKENAFRDLDGEEVDFAARFPGESSKWQVTTVKTALGSLESRVQERSGWKLVQVSPNTKEKTK